MKHYSYLHGFSNPVLSPSFDVYFKRSKKVWVWDPVWDCKDSTPVKLVNDLSKWVSQWVSQSVKDNVSHGWASARNTILGAMYCNFIEIEVFLFEKGFRL